MRLELYKKLFPDKPFEIDQGSGLFQNIVFKTGITHSVLTKQCAVKCEKSDKSQPKTLLSGR